MAGFTGIAAVGRSIERLLTRAFTERQPVPGRTAKAVLIRAEDISDAVVGQRRDLVLTILLYRIDYNKAARAPFAAASQVDGRGHLALDLHYLLTPWAENAEHQHMIIGRAMQALERDPILSGPLLFEPVLPAPQYADEPQASASDSVQIVLEEISTEALMRIFDSLPTDYRLSVPYTARVVRIDTMPFPQAPPVIDADISLRVSS